MNRSLLQPALIGTVSVCATALSVVVAFGGFTNQARAIAVLSSCALIYGLPFAWLESGYILLGYDEKLRVSAVYGLFALVRVGVFGLAVAAASILGFYDVPTLQFAVAAAGLSCGPAVISAVRSKKMNSMAITYIAGAVAALLMCLVQRVTEAVQIVFAYAALTGLPVSALALLRAGRGSRALARALYARTKSFIVDLPVTTVIENGDRLLLSVLSDHKGLVAYNAVKVFFGIQRELNKFVKQMMFHRLFEEVRSGSGRRAGRTFLLLALAAQATAVGGALATYWYVRGHAPARGDIFVALCISSAYTLLAVQGLAAAKALTRESSAFVTANAVGLAVAALAAAVLFLPAPVMQQVNPAYWVAGCYLLFYAAKNAVLHRCLR